YNSNSLRPLLDCMRAKGLGAEALQTLRDIAGKLEISSWTVLWQAVRQYRQLKRPYVWQYNLEFMTREARQDIMSRPPSHPWLEDQDGARAGKVGHVAFLLRVQNHLEGYLRPFDMPLINPLISQPIVELALRIPGWHMVEGGRDRAVARRAYHDALPPIIRDRRRKGSPSSFAISLLRSKQKEVRARLMDGQLVARGMVDADALAAALASEPGIERSYMRLLALLDMEAWIGHWRG
ncbi:MAG: asparagine synthase-related protein, partial [bacterium]|nr:asparagine synthase-related protein [bacterium]